MKNFLKIFLRAGGTIFLFYLLFRNFPISEVIKTLRETSLYLIFLAFFPGFLAFIPATKRWQLFLKGLSFKEMLFLNIGSFFFGTALPGIIFGDAYRFIASGRRREVLDSILMDRGLSFFFVSCFALFLSLFLPGIPLYFKLFLLGLSLVFSVFFIPFFTLSPINKTLFPTLTLSKKALLLACIHSSFFHLLGVLVWILLSHSIHLSVPPAVMIIYYSLLQPVSFIPFTIQGAGLRELLLVYFSRITFYPPEKFLSFGILITGYIFLLAFLCGGIWQARMIFKRV